MKRIVALTLSTLALAACSSPVAPAQKPVDPSLAKAQNALHTASKLPVSGTGRLSSN